MLKSYKGIINSLRYLLGAYCMSLAIERKSLPEVIAFEGID